MKQYFTLLNLPCESNFKTKIERAFIPRLNPTPERYAELRHTYEGYCPLLLENGYCGLHSACGAEALPDVCRLYPRSILSNQGNQASCVNSCERTLEMLFESTNSLAFVPLNLEVQEEPVPSNEILRKQQYQLSIRALCISLLSNREDRFPLRLYKVGQVLSSLDKNEQKDWKSYDFQSDLPLCQVEKTFAFIQSIALWFVERNRSIEEFRQELTQTEADSVMDRYQRKLQHLYAVVPDHDIFMEKALVNHLFYRQFPFTYDKLSLTEHYYALVGLYLFLRYLTMSFMFNRTTIIDYIDVIARAFRVIAHTNFEHNMLILLQNEGINDWESIQSVLTF